jgi:ATP-binding cassette subfamily A (ABC1) protein 3
MIIGEKEPDMGDVYINGYSIQGNQSLARQNLGYCPQFDRLVEFLNVDETLKLFARLRGIEPTLADKISNDMLDIFQLQEFKSTLVQNLRYFLVFGWSTD